MTPAFALPDPVIRFLFRYRDLVAPTLEEHHKIIEKHNACWWGWWKRPTEDARADVWDALAQEIAASGSAAVGLFDSGSASDDAAVRRAKITAVIPPMPGANAAPSVPANE